MPDRLGQVQPAAVHLPPDPKGGVINIPSRVTW